MGIIWKFTMVLLSTLAALVIIVHSAEEEFEAQYRREIRPRSMDTETRRYGEQPWRTMKDETIIMPTIDTIPEEVSDEPPRRRRLGRKRKRRPDTFNQDEDFNTHDRYFSEGPVRPRINSDDEQDVPKRRRKKPENRYKWSDSFEEDRPVRRRGLRRKRPREDPEFSDVVGRLSFNQGQTNPEVDIDHDGYNDKEINFRVNKEDSKYNNREDIGDSNEKDSDESENNKYKKIIKTESSDEDYSRDIGAALYQDRLSKKVDEKSTDYKEMIRKAQENGPIDPISLKDILKKSNGTSLSEILQQHNLSLTDLLHGKEMAISALKSDEPLFNEQQTTEKTMDDPKIEEIKNQIKESGEEKLFQNSETKYVVEHFTEHITTESVTTVQDYTTTEPADTTTEKIKVEEENPKNLRRFMPSARRKQYMRPVVNSKSPLNRDLIALNARNFFNRRRNVTKAQQWRDIIPVMNKSLSDSIPVEKIAIEIPHFNDIVAENTTKNEIKDEKESPSESVPESNDESFEPKEIIEKVEEKPTKEPEEDTPKQLVFYQNSNNSQNKNSTSLRKQNFNNALKKKRRKQKTTTTEAPHDELIKDLFGEPNLAASSNYVAKTQEPQFNIDDDTMLEDFITTSSPSTYEPHRSNQFKLSSTVSPKLIPVVQTAESAKFEIEEILNDTRASAKLSKILMERNMTLSQLIEHRERGSSYVHLADIFHNTSREPNPPEPFLSKSIIEPISKETYPLRALLDANNHDTTTKAINIDSNPTTEYVNIPLKMDFGNNVNENAENMGIMSLFHNINTNVSKPVESGVMKDSEGTPYKSSITVVNASDVDHTDDAIRHGRLMKETNDNQDDIVTWNEIFSFMRRSYENQTNEFKDVSGLVPAESIPKPSVEGNLEDLIVIEETHQIKEFKSHSTTTNKIPTQKVELPGLDGASGPLKSAGILNKLPSPTRSVTLATSCIVGLAMVLFLLSFIGYKMIHRRNKCKKNLKEDGIPSPVFENRKGSKNNNSTRSMSPMLTSNIYTLSTLDSQNGKESPDYMWDSLRKPFQ